MTQATDKQPGVLRSLDWWTIGIYLALLTFGWLSVCGASYTYGDTDIFSLDTRSGMQIVWIGTSVCLGFVLLMLDDRFYDTFAYVIFGLLLALLFVTIFNPHQIKRFALVARARPAEGAAGRVRQVCHGLGPGKVHEHLRLQHTAVEALRRHAGHHRRAYALHHPAARDRLRACVPGFLPRVLPRGHAWCVLFTGVAAVVYFVVGIRFEQDLMFGTPTSVGKSVVLLLVQVFTAGMVWAYTKARGMAVSMMAYGVGLTVVAMLFSVFVIPFDVVWVQLGLTVVMVGWLVVAALGTRLRNFWLITAFAVGSVAFFYSADYVLNNVLEPHQRSRINVLLGLDEDLSGAGYNVHQSEIAIGSGGLEGKGFLNGTQTKLKFVPEQDTDFIFCTVGEEEGFLGSAGVLILFLALILRLIHLAERQPFGFGRIYGYSVLSIFFVPCVHQRGHGAWAYACHRHTPAVLQLRRLVAVGLHHTAFHILAYRCRAQSGEDVAWRWHHCGRFAVACCRCAWNAHGCKLCLHPCASFDLLIVLTS